MTRACAPEPQQRYATATELQAELNLFLAGRSLRRARNVERHLARLKKLAVAACVFLVLAAGAAWFARNEARHAGEKAREANERALSEATLRRRAEAAERQTEQQLHTALLEQARATVRSGEVGQRVRALEALRRAAAISNSVELRREVFAALALPDLRFERILPHGREVTLAQLDPLFERIAVCRRAGPVEIRSVPDDRLLTSLPASTNLGVHVAFWSPDGHFLAVKRDYSPNGARADYELWEPASARRVLLLRDVSMNAAAFHPHRPHFAVGLGSGAVAWWDLASGQEITRFPLAGPPARLIISPAGDRLAVAHPLDAGWRVSVHDATNGVLRSSRVFQDLVTGLDWHPDGRWIAVSDLGTSVHLVDAGTGEARTLGRHRAEAVQVTFSPDGRYLISGGWEREFICWDVQVMRRVFTMGLGSFQLQFRSDGRACAAATPSGVQLHALEQPSAHREFTEDLGGRLRHAAFSPDGRWLAASAEQRAGVWDLVGGGPGALADEAYEAHSFFTPDGGEWFGSRSNARNPNGFRCRISATTNATAPPGLERLTLPKPDGFTFLSLWSNSVVLTTTRGSQMVALENLETGPDRWVRTAAGINGVSPEGRWLAIYRPFSSALYVYRLPGLEGVANLTHPASIGDFEFSPRGDELAVCSSRGGVEFWSTRTWERTRVLTNFTRILFAPDARTVWLRKDLRSAGLYDVRTLEPLLLLPTGMLPLAASPDGRHLAVSVDARRLQVWDMVEVHKQLRELGLDWEGDPESVFSIR